MNKRNDKVNWFYIALGLFFISAFFWTDKPDINEYDLKSEVIILCQDIKKINGTRTSYEYRLNTNKYDCSFIIETAGGMAAGWKNLDSLKKNDTLEIKYHSSRNIDLFEKGELIPIYTVIKDENIIYSLESYKKSQQTLDKRWKIIFLILGVLFILRGLTVISSKMSYIIAGIIIATIIALRFLNIWW